MAKRAGVSVATVSFVLNGKDERIRPQTADRVRDAVDALQYTPNTLAKQLKTRTAETLALLVPDLRNDFFSEIADEALSEAQAHGKLIAMMRLPASEDERHQLGEAFRSGRFAGALVVSRQFDPLLEDVLDASMLPFVMLDESIRLRHAVTLVTGDSDRGGQLVGDYLVNQGHTHLACLTGPQETPNSMRRLSGFLKALMRHDITLKNENILLGDYTLRGGYEAIKNWDDPDVTALFAFNDLSAIGAMQALREKGKRVPEDISVIGYDHIAMADYLPQKLTTVAQQADRIGRRGVRELLYAIDGHPDAETHVKEVLIPPKLVIGETVARRNETPERRTQ
ncbi:MAG: LacI family DNA-binding transcriptional regulator [Peptoniphilaceae bacterium]|nr:LacI family DNA-binding transcriptional regulator [Peptoniphilaceae bacterium]